MRAWGGVALALLLAGCIQESHDDGDPGIRETGYLSCRKDGDACGARWTCFGADGATTCVEPAAGCDALTCDCAGEALCGERACRDVEGGVACGGGPDAAPPPDFGLLPRTDDAALPDFGGPWDGAPPDAGLLEPHWELRVVHVSSEAIRVRGGGEDRAVLRFGVRRNGLPPDPPVALRVTLPADSDAALSVESAVTDAAGEVRVDVQGGTRVGPLAVAARLDDPLPPVGVQATLQVLAGPPSAASLAVSCADPVLAAFLERTPWRFAAGPPSTACQATIADRFGNAVEAPQVELWAEAGEVRVLELAMPPGLFTGDLLATAPPPVDVAPAGPSPEDGLVTMVAVVRGEERFTDLDGNGVWDDGIDLLEPEDDRPEPYLDTNGNGTRDEDEPFRDANENGLWDEGNGLWDTDAEIWAATTVLWVGPHVEAPDVTGVECIDLCALAPPECPGADFRLLPRGSASVWSLFTDANGNCVGGDGGAVTFGATSEAVDVEGEAQPLSQTCFVEGAPRARPLAALLTDGGAMTAEREYFQVEIRAEYPLADGTAARVVRTLTGCR